MISLDKKRVFPFPTKRNVCTNLVTSNLCSKLVRKLSWLFASGLAYIQSDQAKIKLCLVESIFSKFRDLNVLFRETKGTYSSLVLLVF